MRPVTARIRLRSACLDAEGLESGVGPERVCVQSGRLRWLLPPHYDTYAATRHGREAGRRGKKESLDRRCSDEKQRETTRQLGMALPVVMVVGLRRKVTGLGASARQKERGG